MPDADLTLTALRRPDLAHTLPPIAADRLALLRQHRDDTSALLNGISERLEDLRLDMANAAGALRALTEADEGGLIFKTTEGGQLNRLGERKQVDISRDSARIEAAEARLSRATEALDTVLARQTALSGRRSAYAATVDHLEQYIAKHGQLVAFDGPAPRLRRGETVVSAVENCRTKLRDLADHRSDVARAPLPNDEARRRLRQAVINLGDSVRPVNIQAILSAGLEVHQWPTRPLSITTLTPTGEGEPIMGRGTARVPDLMTVLAAIAPDLLIAFLEQSLPDDSNALTDEQRAAKLAEIDRKIIETERQEAALFFMAMEAGNDVVPRPDAAPAAVLAVAAP